MQQFTALLKKEFCEYFKNYFALFLLFIYLFASVGSAFYFGSYLAARDSGMFSLFYLQPVVLSILCPAVTMKLWSEEYKSGTAEFLLTQPIKSFLLVLAKFCAATLFIIFMSAFFIPFIWHSANFLQIDSGAILCNYLGLFLLILFYCAIGCFISSLCYNIILTYILSVFTIIFIISFPFTYMYPTYYNFLFGEISFSDVFYFLSITVLLLTLNVFVLEYRRSAQKNKTLKFLLLCLLYGGGVLLLNIITFNVFNYKFDLTSAAYYTPSENSAKILQNLNKNLILDVFVSKDYKKQRTENFYFYEQIKRFLNKYKNYANGLLSVNFVEVEAFSEMENLVLRRGLYYEKNQADTKDYFGAILHDKDDNSFVIKQFLPQRFKYVEKDLDKAVLKLVYPELIKTIGVYLDPMQNLDDFNGIMLNLENDYNLFNVTANTYEISPEMDMLLLINPKKLPPYFLYAIDQYIVNGGKTVIFFDYLTENQNKDINYSDIDIINFLNAWKIKVINPLEDNVKLQDKFISDERNDIVVKKAASFAVEYLKNTPFFINDNKIIGTVIKDKIQSIYMDNPFNESDFARDMMPHTVFGIKESLVALIGDVDILLDQNWISAESPDKNPYSVINSAANGEFIRSLIDKLIGNDVYSILTESSGKYNLFSIGESLNKEAFNKYSDELSDINHKIFGLQLSLFEQSDENIDKMKNLMDTDEKGKQIVFLEDQRNLISHKIKQYYSLKIKELIIKDVLLIPFLSLLALFLLIFSVIKINNKITKDKIYE